MWNGRACTLTHRGPSRYTLNVLFLWAYDYLDCECGHGVVLWFMTMEHFNYACHP